MTGVVLDRVQGRSGELVLTRRGPHLEVVGNGVFLMDTRDGRSERLLATAALDRHPRPGRVLVGGLGVGVTLRAVLADPRVTAVEVVEVEEALVGWHRRGLLPDAGLDDPRVAVTVSDLRDVLAGPGRGFDLICLDVDNGPDWTVTEGNRALYDAAGTARLVRRLRPGGVLAVWSARPVPAYDRQLRQHLCDVETLTVPVARGEPDAVHLGRRPGGPQPP